MAPPPNHLEFIRSLSCVRCGRCPCEAAHVRYSDARFDKVNPGMGKKSEIYWTVPLCSECHRGKGGQHTRGEQVWWRDLELDPVLLALAYKAVSGNHEAGQAISRRAYYQNSFNR